MKSDQEMKKALLHDRLIFPVYSLGQVIGEIPPWFLFSIPFVVMILITKLNFHLITDEGVYHIRVIESFANTWPSINIADYPSASTPLPYILLTIFGKIVGLEIYKLRLLPAIATYFSVNVFYILCRRHKLPHPLISSFIFLFFPYVFFYGFTIYPASFALCFGLGAMNYYLLNDATNNQLIQGSILATMAVYCRQFYLVLPLGMIIVELWQLFRHDFITSLKQRFLRLIILAIPVVLILPLFIAWGGFTTPFNQASQGGTWYFTFMPHHLNFFFILVGFYFLPRLIKLDLQKLLKNKLFIISLLIMLLPLNLLFPIVFSNDSRRVVTIAGLITHGLEIVRQILGSNLSYMATIGLWAVGVLIVLSEWMNRPWDMEKRKLFVCIVIFMTLITLTPYVYERYYLLLIPFLVLLFHRSHKSRKLLCLWVAGQTVLSIGFSYWQIVIK